MDKDKEVLERARHKRKLQETKSEDKEMYQDTG